MAENLLEDVALMLIWSLSVDVLESHHEDVQKVVHI